MTEKMVPPPLPNTGSATPPPLPKAGATPPPLPVGKASPPPLPTTNIAPPPLPKAESAPPPIPSVAVASPPPVPAQKSEPPPVPVAAVVPEALKVSAPPVQIEANSSANTSETATVPPTASGTTQQPASAAASGKSISTGAKLGISFAAMAVLAGVGYGMFGGKEAGAPHPEKQAAAPVPTPVPAVAPAPVAPAPNPNAVDEKEDKIRQLESQLAAAEAEKQRALQAAEQRKSSERSAASAPATAPSVRHQPSGGTYSANSRAQGQSCNSHADCQSEFMCNSGQCVPSARAVARAPVTTVPNSAKHLFGAYYLVKDTVKDMGNGFRTIYSYLNADVPIGQQYHGQVGSQVARYVMNCQQGLFGYDQLYYFSQPHARGERVAAQEWQPNQVAFNPIQNAEEHIRKSYDFACKR